MSAEVRECQTGVPVPPCSFQVPRSLFYPYWYWRVHRPYYPASKQREGKVAFWTLLEVLVSPLGPSSLIIYCLCQGSGTIADAIWESTILQNTTPVDPGYPVARVSRIEESVGMPRMMDGLDARSGLSSVFSAQGSNCVLLHSSPRSLSYAVHWTMGSAQLPPIVLHAVRLRCNTNIALLCLLCRELLLLTLDGCTCCVMGVMSPDEMTSFARINVQYTHLRAIHPTAYSSHSSSDDKDNATVAHSRSSPRSLKPFLTGASEYPSNFTQLGYHEATFVWFSLPLLARAPSASVFCEPLLPFAAERLALTLPSTIDVNPSLSNAFLSRDILGERSATARPRSFVVLAPPHLVRTSLHICHPLTLVIRAPRPITGPMIRHHSDPQSRRHTHSRTS